MAGQSQRRLPVGMRLTSHVSFLRERLQGSVPGPGTSQRLGRSGVA